MHGLTILTGKNCVLFSSAHEYFPNRRFPVFELFHMFTELIKFYILYCHILKSTYVCSFINTGSNRQIMNKISPGLCLSTGKRFASEVYF